MSEYLKLFKKHDLHIQSEYKSYNKQYKFKVGKCGHTVKSTPKSIKRNIQKNGKYECPDCKKEETKFSFEQVKEIVLNSTQKEYKVVSLKKDYENTRSKISIFHKSCGEITDLTYKNFSLGRRCRHCAAKTMNSKASQLLKRLFKQVNIEFEEEKIFENCINHFTERNLPFDFYIEKLNTAIEIDGEQHFIPIERWGGEDNLRDTQYRDFIKDKYCLENDIKLIRVSLLDLKTKKKKRYDDVKTIIFNLLHDLALEYHKET